MSQDYPVESFDLPQIEDYHWELSDRHDTARKSLGLWLTTRHGSTITIAWCSPNRKSIEAAGRHIERNWRTWQQIRAQLGELPVVADNKWEFEELMLASDLIEIRFGDSYYRHGHESAFSKLTARSVQRTIKRLARLRARQERFVQQDFGLPQLPAGESWKISYNGGPLPHVRVEVLSLHGSTRHELTTFTRYKVRRAARKLVGSDSRNRVFFDQLQQPQG